MTLTPSGRIALNVTVTYGRSLVGIACGLFSGRWLLQALGEVDYGLWGVIGSLVAFVAFVNGMMSQAVSRFLAVAVGKDRMKAGLTPEDGVCDWFWTAVVVHGILATVLIALGFGFGDWLVGHWLTVPPTRLEAAHSVWRCVCLSAWLGMVLVPWSSLYVAKQEIAVQTVYGLVSNLANTAFLAWMAWHPSDWLARYALWSVLVTNAPLLLLAVRAHFMWPEISWSRRGISWRSGFRSRLGELSKFVGWRLFGCIAGLLSCHGVAVAVNRFLGPVANAAVTVGNTVGQQSMTLSGAMAGAISPAIANAVGEGKLHEMRNLAFVACRMGTLSVLVFSIPLLFEMDAVMTLWLGKVPAGAEWLCACVLVAGALDKIVDGHWMCILSLGKIRGYQLACSGCACCAFLLVVISFCGGWWGLAVVGWAFILDKALAVAVRLVFGRLIAGLGVFEWLRQVLFPCSLACVVASLLGFVPRFFGMEPGILRVIVTAACTSLAFLPEGIRLLRRRRSTCRFDIDLVYCWCNGRAFEEIEKCRFSNNGELFHSIRSVDRNAPWFRTIWVFVNDGTEIPDWLRRHPKVRIVTHSQVIPKDVLPLYNSASIEFWLWKIPGLSEHFVYANDDMFLYRNTPPYRFFLPDGRPICRYERDSFVPRGTYGAQLLLDRAFMRGFKGESLVPAWRKAVDHAPHHNMDAYLRSEMEGFCRRFPEVMKSSATPKFRSSDQLNRDVFSLWAIATGKGVFRFRNGSLLKALTDRLFPGVFPPRWESLSYGIHTLSGYGTIERYRPYMFCLNDGESATDEHRRQACRWLNKTFGDLECEKREGE